MKKNKLINIILEIFVFISIFIFLYYVTLPQTIIWLKEIPSYSKFSLKSILFSIKIVLYNIGAFFILLKLYIGKK